MTRITIFAATLVLSLVPGALAQTDTNLGKIMPLGDSITKGAPAGAYRDPLFTLLKKSGCTFQFVGSLKENPTAALTEAGQDRHEGHSGMGMEWIDGHLKEYFAANPPDRILLAIGANDIGGATVPELRARMDKLVADIFALRPEVRLYLASVTPQTGPAMVKIREFNKLIPGIVAEHQSKGRRAIYVSMDALDLKDLEDNVHPNVSGSLKMAQAWHAALVPSPRKIVSLDGCWQFAEGAMGESPKAFDRKIPVPGLADMAAPAFEGVGVKDKDPRREAFWYRRTFAVPGGVPSVARLKIYKACYGTRVYLNGQLLGDHVGCFTPGYFDVAGVLKGGGQPNELVIRVGAAHTAVGDDVPWGHDFEKIRYVPGIYDSVELILSGSPSIDQVQAVPDVAGKRVRVVAVVKNRAKTGGPVEATVRCVVCEARSGRQVGSAEGPKVSLKAGEERSVEFSAAIDGSRLWTPEDPFLYEMDLSVATGGTFTDAQTVRFGMRSFAFDPKTKVPLLNGKPYYLRGTNICIYRFFEDPLRGDRPWNEQWVRRVIRGFRSMHWNSARYCIGFPPEMWYRIADEEGLLIQDEFPVWGKTGSLENLTAQYAEWMRERWNHPSVVIWDAQNETPKQNITGKALSAVRHLDLSNRPWDNGWDVPQSPTDVYESHPYRHIKKGFRMSEFAAMSPKPGDPGSDANNAVPNRGDNPIIINEYGWLWLNRDGTPTTLPIQSKSYQYLAPPGATPDQYREAYARTLAAKTEFWRCGRKVAGVMHFCGLGYSRPGGQTSDNYINIDRAEFEPHFFRYVRDAFAPVGLMLDFWADQSAAGAKLKLPVVVINDLDRPWEGPITLRLTHGDKLILEKTLSGKVLAAGREVFPFDVSAPEEVGSYRLTAELPGADGKVVHSLRDFRVETPQR